jgi:orotidine-5'-phosphate decarboxylase
MKKKLVIALDNMSKENAKDFVTSISSSLDSNQIVYKVNDLLALV